MAQMPLAHDLADVAGALQQLRQEELSVWDATHDLLRRIGPLVFGLPDLPRTLSAHAPFLACALVV